MSFLIELIKQCMKQRGEGKTVLIMKDRKEINMAKVYVFLADGFEEVEALIQVDLLRRASVNVETVSIMEGKLVKGAHDIAIMADILFRDDLLDADMLVLPGGGTGTKNLMNHQGLKNLMLEYNKQKKYLAAICAAPGVFGVNQLLQGKNAVCYPGHEPNLYGAIILDQNVVEDANFITSKAAGTSFDFGLTLVRILCGEETSELLRKNLCYERG